MIDNAVASSSATLDLKVQSKTGNKADKAEKSHENHRKAAFQDALKAQGHGRPDKGKVAAADDLVTDPDNALDEAASDTEGQGANPVKTRIPRVHFNHAAKTEDSPEASVDTLKEPTGEIKPKGPEERKQAHANEGLHLGQLKAENADQPETRDTPAPAPEATGKKLVRGPVQKAADAETSKAADDAAPAPARDVLNLLAEKGHGADAMNGPMAAHGQTTAAAPADGTDTGGEAIQRYRVSRADGRGGLVEIEGRDRTGETDKTGGTQKAGIQDVTVLDQRRFLAPSEQGNLQSVLNAISGDPEWQVAMQPGSELANAAAQAGAGKVVNTLKIQMHPIELGLVTATMRLQGEELTVELKVHTGVAYKQLRDDQSQIIESLKAQGFNVDQVSVVFAPDRSDQASGQQAQANGQGAGFAQQQQQTRDGNQGNAPGRLARIAAQERAGGHGNEQAEIQTDGASGSRGAGGRSQSVWL